MNAFHLLCSLGSHVAIPASSICDFRESLALGSTYLGAMLSLRSSEPSRFLLRTAQSFSHRVHNPESWKRQVANLDEWFLHPLVLAIPWKEGIG